MALKNVMVAAVLSLSAQAFASARVADALTLTAPAAKVDKAKATKAKVFDRLTTEQTQKTVLPKNARHDATAGVFI